MPSLKKYPWAAAIMLTTLLPICWSGGAAPTAEEPEVLDWWAIDRGVSHQLITQEKNLIDWAHELTRAEPGTPHEAIIKIDVCMRAALDDEACDALRTLRRLEPEVSNHLLSGIYYQATDDHQAWAVARVLTETFAPRIHDLELENRLFGHFRKSERTRRAWSDEQLIAWLDARVESVRRYDREVVVKTVPGDVRQRAMRFGQPQPIDFWRRLRLQQLSQLGKAKATLTRLEAAVRAEPENAEPAIEYLESLTIVRRTDAEARSRSLDWMAKVCRPVRATELRTIASLLTRMGQPGPAETMLRRAIETKLTDEEISRLSMMCRAVFPHETHRLFFAVGLREELAKCLLKLGRADESQVVMVAAADMRQKNKLPLNLYLSGTVQRASGARVIEGRVREQEKENKDDPQYWRRRAEYFRGRGEVKEEESALRRGFALCVPAPEPRGKGAIGMRRWLLSDLTRFLIRHKRHEEAVELLLAEMREAPANSASSKAAARSMAFDLVKYINPRQPVFWNWLAQRETWSHTEKRLLWRMLEATPPNSIDAHFTRAERLALADSADASRAATLGWILNRMKQAQRSIGLLVHATENATRDDLREKASFTLFESYLDLSDWRKAEAIFDRASRRLTSSESPEWLGRIATIAAAQGDQEDAMRIWRRVANCSLRNKRLVDDLSKRGLRQPLRTYYAEVQRRLPTAKLAEVVQ